MCCGDEIGDDMLSKLDIRAALLAADF